MTPEAETATQQAQAPTASQSPDLLGLAYLGVVGAIMMIWLGLLIWIAFAACRWLVS